MFDIFQLIIILLIVFAAALLYKNRIWKTRPIFIVFFAVIIISFLVILLI